MQRSRNVTTTGQRQAPRSLNIHGEPRAGFGSRRSSTTRLRPVAAAWLTAALLSGCVANGMPQPGAARSMPEVASIDGPRNEQSAQFWRDQGQAAVDAARRAQPTGPARNVILFVGDGMGVSTVSAARILAGQLQGDPGEENLLSFERFPRSALAKTYTTNQQTSDSAGTMTAMITGVKTLAGVISVDGSVTRGDCASSQGAGLPSLVELAEQAGLATGVVSTARVTHATPAATFAKSPERNWEADSTMPAAAREAGCDDIASQLLSFDHGDGIDVVLGGGRAMFLPAAAVDPEYDFLNGRRGDGRNLVDEWLAARPGAHYVWNDAQFRAIPDDGRPVLGLFEPSHMQFEADRPRDPAGEPSLAEMTRLAIERLDAKGTGYVLVVEAGRIDHAHHASNAYRALTDTIALSEAVDVATELTSEQDTLVLVTADHSHTLTFAGYPTRGNPILGFVVTNDEQGRPMDSPWKDAFGQPFTTLAYGNGPGHQAASESQPAGPKRGPHQFGTAAANPDGRSGLADIDPTDPSYLQESVIPLGSETHAGEDVPVYVRGPGAGLLGGVIEQNVVYYILEAALGDALTR